MRKRIGPVAILLVFAVLLGFLWQNVYRIRFLTAIYPRRYSAYVSQYAAQNKVDPYLVYAVIKNESGFDPQAVSRIGAKGLMQLTPDTFEWAQSKNSGKNEVYDSSHLFEPQINIRYGTQVLSQLLTEFGNDETALAAYHAGRGNVKKWLGDTRYSADGRTLSHIPFDDTRAYVQNVLRTRQIYKSLYANSKGV